MRYEEFKFEDIEVGDELQWKMLSSLTFNYGQCYKVLSIDGFITIDNNGVKTLVNGGDINWNLIKRDNLPKVQSLPPFKNMKFRVENEEHSKQIQEYLFSIGYNWEYDDYKSTYQFTSSDWLLTDIDGIIYQVLSPEEMELYKEYKLIPHTTYSLEPVTPKIEVVNILGKQYNKVDVEELLKTLEEVK